MSTIIGAGCSTPPKVAHGKIVLEDMVPVSGAKAIIECEEGFILTKTETIVCDKNGKWTNTDGQCTGKQIFLENIKHVRYILSSQVPAQSLMNHSNTYFREICIFQMRKKKKIKAVSFPISLVFEQRFIIFCNTCMIIHLNSLSKQSF